MQRVARGPRMALLATLDEYPQGAQERGAQDTSGNRVAFSLVTFFWRRKRK
jgi:hypothetical protein